MRAWRLRETLKVAYVAQAYRSKASDDRCELPRQVYMDFQLRTGWQVYFMERDVKTNIGRGRNFADPRRDPRADSAYSDEDGQRGLASRRVRDQQRPRRAGPGAHAGAVCAAEGGSMLSCLWPYVGPNNVRLMSSLRRLLN